MTVQEVVDGAATLLGDAAKLTWTDTVLLPYVKEAHQEIQNTLIMNGFRPFSEISVVLTVLAGETTLPPAPITPDDFFLPIKIQESSRGANAFFDMVERDWEPDMTPTNNLIYWAMRSNGVHFVGANEDRDVKLFYVRGTLGSVSQVDDTLAINNAVPIYTAMTAYLCAALKGRNPKAAAEIKEIYGTRLATYLTIEIQNRQALIYRRRPFTAKRNLLT